MAGNIGEMNVNIAETIRGLKAIQREAKKATQALRDLESTETGGVFKTNDRLTWEGAKHRVIIADAETAILAPVIGYTDELGYVKSTKYADMFAVSNQPELYGSIADEVVRI
ncbi:hypothetical protein MKX34_23925 [Paenibacillus sp. FSL R5-0636]|uniref:hypothetical protein n=1 Tax=Paenibacillus TaxID=44249 RepID=UPI0009700F3C|nr:hypothetical protein [Paenibacillus odorifer]OMC96219.1 hypothetical protein BJP49_10985 [Paenibacillus odorifer]